MNLLQFAPTFSPQEAAAFARDSYGIVASVSELPSERDQNFLLTTESGERFVLKIANAQESVSFLEAQNDAMRHLAKRVSFCPRLVASRSGDEFVLTHQSGAHFMRLVNYIPGLPLAKVTQNDKVLFELGKTLGQLRKALSDFDHKSLHRTFHWDLSEGLQVINEYKSLVRESDLRNCLTDYANRFSQAIGSRLRHLPVSVIHGDANDHNVIVQEDRIVGLIDFGDMVHSYTVGDLAIAIAYVVLDKQEPLASAETIVAGYTAESALSEGEINALWWLALLRLCMSVCLAVQQQRQKPENEYLDVSQRSIRHTLPALLAINPDAATEALLGAQSRSSVPSFQ